MERKVIKLWSNVKPCPCPEEANYHEHLVPTPQNDGNDRYTEVTEPEMHFFPASGPAPHPAVLVCPGGGYSHLAWTHEGMDIASLLNVNGISAFVLKYRCPKRRDAAFADAARAMRIIRANAEAFATLPDKIGAIGFSAGAHLAAMLSASAEQTPYPPLDDLDKNGFRPNFTVLVYPAYLANDELKISPEFNITADMPHTLIIQTQDDPIKVVNSLGWYHALTKAGVPAEMHLFAQGGHGYGIMRKGFPVINWGNLAGEWMRRQTGIL